MMNFDQTIESSVIRAKSYFLFMLAIVSIGTGITLLMANISKILIPIGLVIFWVGPLLFFKNNSGSLL
jgi:hypothetical protein